MLTSPIWIAALEKGMVAESIAADLLVMAWLKLTLASAGRSSAEKIFSSSGSRLKGSLF